VRRCGLKGDRDISRRIVTDPFGDRRVADQIGEQERVLRRGVHALLA